MIDIDQASKIGWTKFCWDKYIRIKETTNPKYKLPLSPKNNLGKLKIEKLKNRKIVIGNKIIIKNNLKFLSGTKKYKINRIDIVKKLRFPSIPSK